MESRFRIGLGLVKNFIINHKSGVITFAFLLIFICYLRIETILPVVISSSLDSLLLLLLFGIPYSLDLFIPNLVEDKVSYWFLTEKFDLFPYSSPALMYFLSFFRIMLFWVAIQSFFSKNYYFGNHLIQNLDGIFEMVFAIILYVVLINVGMMRRLLNKRVKKNLNEKYQILLKKHSDFTKASLIPVTAFSVIMGIVGVTAKDFKSMESFLISIGIKDSGQMQQMFSVGVIFAFVIIVIATSYFANKLFQYLFDYII